MCIRDSISGPNAICPGESINLAANSGDAVSYAWTATGGTLSNPSGQNTNYTMMIPGVYTITVVTTNSEGCTASNSTNVIVNETPVISATNIINTSCGDANGQIITTVSGGSAPFTYAWNTGDTTPNLSGLPAGIYCVTVTNAESVSYTHLTLPTKA